jgi:hypothetical protein
MSIREYKSDPCPICGRAGRHWCIAVVVVIQARPPAHREELAHGDWGTVADSGDTL